MNIINKLGTLFVVGLIAPVGLLFAQTSAKPATTTTASVRSADPTMTGAENAFSNIQDLAQDIRREVAPLKFSTNGTSVTWQIHSTRLTKVKQEVNQMETDLNRLAARKQNLPGWQQELLSSVKTDTNEIANQTQAAINELNKVQNASALAATRYPQYIGNISQKANDAASSIGTVFQRRGYDMD